MTNRLIGVDVTAWAESLNRDGFFVFRTNNACTGQPTNGIYSMGYVIYFKDNIRIVIYDMFSPSEIYTRSKANGNSWSAYKKVATNNI